MRFLCHTKSRHARADPRTPWTQGVTDLLMIAGRTGKPGRPAMSNLDAIRAKSQPLREGRSLGAHMLFSFQRPMRPRALPPKNRPGR